jgi:DNA mismatch repair protein MutL
VAKELVENSIDAGARRVEVDVEAGGRRLLRVSDDGSGMTRDDAVLAFERHATSKIATAEDLTRISTLGFRGEALASIASVARVELVTQVEGEAEGTRVVIEGGRMRDVSPAARPRGTTIAVRDLFFNVPPQGAFPAALLFLEVPLADVDVNVHPAKTEVRFRRAAAVADAVRDAVRASLATSGFLRLAESPGEYEQETALEDARPSFEGEGPPAPPRPRAGTVGQDSERQEAIEFGKAPTPEGDVFASGERLADSSTPPTSSAPKATARSTQRAPAREPSRQDDARDEGLRPAGATGAGEPFPPEPVDVQGAVPSSPSDAPPSTSSSPDAPRSTAGEGAHASALPPVSSVAALVREVPADSLSAHIRPLGQLDESYIVATDAEGLLLIEQHAAHERILFDKYLALEETRAAESQHLLVPETFDLSPAQAAAFDDVSPELERYGFGLMRLSGRTVAVRAVPADLPAGEARNLLTEILDSVDAERRGRAHETLRERVAASLASRAAVKPRTPLTREKMSWLIERLLRTSSPTTSPRGRPIILRLAKRDIERGFHRS